MSDRKNPFKENDRPDCCTYCGGSLIYVGHGQYKCNECNNITYDDFGLIRKFLDDNGPSTSVTISENTGIPIKKINELLRDSRMEITADSPAFIQCERCGADIRHGRLCANCASAATGGYSNKSLDNRSQGMHYIGRNKK